MKAVDPFALGPRKFSALLALILLCAFPGVLLGWVTFLYRDFGTFTYPLAYYHRHSIWQGELPLWNPYNNCGVPFLAQWNTLVLYPPSVIYLLLPMPWSLNIFCLAHLFFGGLGMYFLARRWCGNALAAGLAGILFALNGTTQYCLMWSGTSAALAWMPWTVLGIERAWLEGKQWVVWAALIAALQLLAGSPEIVFLTWCFLLLFAGSQWASGRYPRKMLVVRLASVALLVAGLTAVQMLPFFDLVAHSHRDARFAGEQAGVGNFWTMSYDGWANLFVPLFRCQLTPLGSYVHGETSWMSTFYLGAGGIALAILGVLASSTPRVKLMSAVVVISWLLALGPKGHLYTWFNTLFPPIRLMQYPIKFVLLAIFLTPLLAAYGFQALQNQRPRQVFKVWRSVWFIIATLLGLIVVILWISFINPIPGEDRVTTLFSGLQSAGFLVIIFSLLYALVRVQKPLARGLLSLGLLSVVAADLLTHMPGLNPVVSPKVFEPNAVQLSPVPELGKSRAAVSMEAYRLNSRLTESDKFRYLGLMRLGLLFSCNLLDQIPKIDGFFPLWLGETRAVERLLGLYFPPRLADFLGITHLTSPKTIIDWTQRPTAMPWVTGGQRPLFDSPQNILSALTNAAFAPEKVVYLPPAARPFITVSNETKVQIQTRRFAAHRIELEVEAVQPSLVVIAQSYYHPWQAYVGNTRTTIWRANYACQAIQVPTGRHHITLKYEDRAFYLGAVISLITAVLCFIYSRLARGSRIAAVARPPNTSTT